MKLFVKNDFDNIIINFIKFYDIQIIYVNNNNIYIVIKYVLIDVWKFKFILTKKIISTRTKFLKTIIISTFLKILYSLKIFMLRLRFEDVFSIRSFDFIVEWLLAL